METSITVISSNSSLAEVKLAELATEIAQIEDVKIGPTNTINQEEGRVARVTGLEILATFLGSAAAFQLARAIRDFVNRQKVEIKLTNSDGSNITVSATGGEDLSVPDIVGFITRQHIKHSADIKIDNKNLDDTRQLETSMDDETTASDG